MLCLMLSPAVIVQWVWKGVCTRRIEKWCKSVGGGIRCEVWGKGGASDCVLCFGVLVLCWGVLGVLDCYWDFGAGFGFVYGLRYGLLSVGACVFGISVWDLGGALCMVFWEVEILGGLRNGVKA